MAVVQGPLADGAPPPGPALSSDRDLAKFHLDRSEFDQTEDRPGGGPPWDRRPRWPLGHDVLADVYNRVVRPSEAEEALRTARALEGR